MRYLIAVVALAAILPIQLHAQQTWHVYPGQSIQAAIDNADPGDNVVVHSEIFRGYTYYESITLAAGVSVYSVDYEEPVTIHGGGSLHTVSFSGNGQGMYFGGEDVGFIIDGSTSQAVWLSNCYNIQIEDLNIESTGIAQGVMCNADDSVHLDDIHVTGQNSYGMSVWGDVVLTDCRVENCGEGMRVMAGGATVESAHIWDCDYGFVAAATSGLLFESSTIEDCSVGVYMFNWSSSPSEPATFSDLTIENCELGMDISTYASVTEWADIDDCEFWYCDDAIYLGNFKGSVTRCDFVEIYDTALELSTSHAVASIGGDGQGNHFQLVDGIGIHLASNAQATVEDNEFHYVLGTAIQCETGTDGTTIRDCIVDGTGGCFQGIYTDVPAKKNLIRDCKIRDYAFTGGVPIPRGANVYWRTADLGNYSDWGYNNFQNTGKDLMYRGPSGTTEWLPAQGNWWGEAPPNFYQSFGGNLMNYIDYSNWLPEPPPGAPPAPPCEPVLPEKLAITSVFPNPAAEVVRFSLALPGDGLVHLTVWNLNGRLVKDLVKAEYPAGICTVEWDGIDEFGAAAPAGTYVCRLQSSSASTTRRFVLVQ